VVLKAHNLVVRVAVTFVAVQSSLPTKHEGSQEGASSSAGSIKPTVFGVLSLRIRSKYAPQSFR
jgi:hypothetical protein